MCPTLQDPQFSRSESSRDGKVRCPPGGRERGAARLSLGTAAPARLLPARHHRAEAPAQPSRHSASPSKPSPAEKSLNYLQPFT